MSVEFIAAKNGGQSAKANGVFLHSAYNPEVEAERFVQSLESSFNPAAVIILEPALSHSASFLRKKFPGAKIGAVRFCQDFKSFDKEWDFCIDADGDIPLSERLYNALGEEGLFSSLFFEWPPAVRAWPELTKEAWSQIKAALQKAQAALATREHFGRRWLKNKIIFFRNASRTELLQKIERPVVVCASGPSLETALPAIAKERQKIFLCALSSAAGVLAARGIEPDLCLSTDGGYWAKKHLDIFCNRFKDVPLALATEAACPARLLFERRIVPLCYDDDELSKRLFSALGMDFIFARRNGTVSGTALELFLDLARGNIYFAGLDLQNSKGMSHARPNALEAISAQSDFRLRPKETRAALRSFKNSALELYADWFCSKNLGQRQVYRIKGQEPFLRTLGAIKDISAEEFEKAIEAETFAGPDARAETFAKTKNAGETKTEAQKRERTIRRVFEEWLKSPDAAAELFPADTIIARREKETKAQESRLLQIERKRGRLLTQMFKDCL